MAYAGFVELISKYLPHPQAIELNKWIDQLRKENEELRKQIEELKAPKGVQPEGIPSCPNCSTEGRLIFMSPIPEDFIKLENATHECTKCGLKLSVDA